jgi:predicted nucleotidyltransferase component of viral defense system
MNQTYINAVRLLLAVAPVVFRKPLFALKGGTAINLFIRDMPRLSVDLDLVYADRRPSREAALSAVSDSLETIRDERSLCAWRSHARHCRMFCVLPRWSQPSGA